MSKNKINKEFITPEKIHEVLFACINCVFEDKCEKILPFPINLCDKCENYIKRELVIECVNNGLNILKQ